MIPGAFQKPAGRLYVAIVTGLAGIAALACGLDDIASQHRVAAGLLNLGYGALVLTVWRLCTVGERLRERAQSAWLIGCIAGFGMIAIAEGYMGHMGIISQGSHAILSPMERVYAGSVALSLALTMMLSRKGSPRP